MDDVSSLEDNIRQRQQVEELPVVHDDATETDVEAARARVLRAIKGENFEQPDNVDNKQNDWDDITDLWDTTTPQDNINRINTEKRTSRENIRDVTARRAAATALSAIDSIAGPGIAEQYRNRIPEGDNAAYDTLKPIVEEINQIVKQDWRNKMTDIESYKAGDDYNFICQSIQEPYKASEYLGNYASCSLLTGENHNTYSTGFGFIYAPEDIVAASGTDINLENRATSDDDVMRLQSIPTIDSVDNVLKQQSDIMKNDPENAHRHYNEVGVRAGQPIGIFCLSDGKDGNNPMSNYAKAVRLQQLNPGLKLAILSKGIDATEEQLQSDIINNLDDDELVW